MPMSLSYTTLACMVFQAALAAAQCSLRLRLFGSSATSPPLHCFASDVDVRAELWPATKRKCDPSDPAAAR